MRCGHVAYAVGQRGDQLRRQRFMTREVGWVESGGRVAGLRVMGIYAHPDDEAFSLAGSFARVTNAGHMAALLCATRGERGEIADPALATPETLGAVREQELRQACAEVGVDDVSFLGYSDGELAQADEAEAVGRIVAHLRRFKPDVVVTFTANGGYGHLDHMAIHRLTNRAVLAAAEASGDAAPHRVRKLYYNAIPRERMAAWRDRASQSGQDFTPGGNAATIPLVEMGTPQAEITTEVHLSDAEFARKQRALRHHATQMPADNPMVRASAEELRTLIGIESFVLAPPPLSAAAYPTPEHDLLAGL